MTSNAQRGYFIAVTAGKLVALLTGAVLLVQTSMAQDGLWFQDGFESGDLDKRATRADSSWRWGTTGVEITSAGSHGGNYAVAATYGPDADGDDSWRELIFDFGKELDEVWIEYWIRYPINYYHRDSSGADNNKFLQLNRDGGGTGKNMLTIESARESSTGYSNMRRFLSETEHPDGSNNWPTSDSRTSNFIGDGDEYAIQLGQWSRIRIYYRAGSNGIDHDGRAAIWVGDGLFHTLDWPFWQPDSGGKIDGGYLPGWSNSGFTEATTILIDDFRVFDSDPGWSKRPSPPVLSVE